MKVISVANIKGGVAKSTTAIVLAQILSEEYRVLLVDTDPQNALTSHFIEDVDLTGGYTIRQVLKHEVPIERTMLNIRNNLNFVPSEIELAMIEKELGGVSNQHFLLHEVIDSVGDDYDYCIIDTSPNVNLLFQSAMIASDFVVIPTQFEKWSMRAIYTTLMSIEPEKRSKGYINRPFERIIVLPTFYEENRSVKAAFYQILKEKFIDYISQAVIHSSTELAKVCAINGKFLSKKTRAYKEYSVLANEITGRVYE